MKRYLHHGVVMCGRKDIGTRAVSVTSGKPDTGSANARVTTSISRPGRSGTIAGNWNADGGIAVIAMATAFQTRVIVHRITPTGAKPRDGVTR
jgi:hypothetical protein